MTDHVPTPTEVFTHPVTRLTTDVWVQSLKQENGTCVVTATSSPIGHGADFVGKVTDLMFRVHLRDAPRLKQRLSVTISEPADA